VCNVPHTTMSHKRPTLPCATALLHKAKEVASESRSHDTLCCTRGIPATSTQGGRGARPLANPRPTDKGADGITPGQEERVSLLLGSCLSCNQRVARRVANPR
jgi:hypothetical protein